MECGQDNSFITINSIRKSKNKKLLSNNEINFKSKYAHLKSKLPSLSQEKLIYIAKNDRSWQIRRLALRNIKNRNIAFRIALNDKNPNLRKYALQYNKNASRYLVLNDPSVEVREYAINYIKDMHLLKYLVLNDPSIKVRSKAVVKIKNKSFLKELINSDIDLSAKRYILKSIDDQNFLFNLFKNPGLYDLKYVIVEQLTNQKYIFDLIMDESDFCLTEKLINKLNEEALLLKAFDLEKNILLKGALFNKLRYESSFEYIFLNDSSNEFRSKSVKYINNAEILFRVIYGNYDYETKEYAIENLNEEYLFKICNDLSVDEDLRVMAVLNIKKEEKLINICENTSNILMILSALSNIKNMDFILNFGVKHENWKVRSLAISKIDDEELLFDIALKETNWFSRELAIENISDDEKLFKILLEEDNNQIKKLIVNSIKNPEILLNVLKMGYVNLINLNRECPIVSEDVLTYIALNNKFVSQRLTAVKYIENMETLKDVLFNEESEEVCELILSKFNENYESLKSEEDYEASLFLDKLFYEYFLNIGNDYVNVNIIKLVKNIENGFYLKDLALNAKNSNVRINAISSDNFDVDYFFNDDEIMKCLLILTEMEFIPDVADENEYELFSKIQDESLLINYIIKYSGQCEESTVFNALDFITNEEFLFKIVYCEKLGLDVLKVVVDEITNQEMLEEILINHPNVYVRNQTIKRIKNKKLIKDRALNDPSDIIRESAIIWDEYECDGWSISKVCESKIIISDEEILEEILFESNDEKIRKIALYMINDEDRLSRIAEKSRDYKIRLKATQSLQNQDTLVKIVLNDPSRIVKKTAINLLDEENLIKIIYKLSDWYIRNYGLKLINDDDTIINFAFNDSNWHVRNTAVLKITDEEILKKIALTDTNINIRKVAIEKITNKDILKDILNKTTHYTTPKMVKEKLWGC